MWWWLILEGASWIFFGATESGTWKRSRFRKYFGADYDTVLGRDLENYLNSLHSVPENWTWHTSIVAADREAKRFEVKYDDGYGQSGIVEISVTGSSLSYRTIDRKSR